MLPWWGWLTLWVVLVLGGVLLVGLRARVAWRSVRALSAEVSRAGKVLQALETQAERLRAEPDADARTAVTQDPHRLREEYRRRRAEQAAARSARRAARMPRWARVD